MKIKVKLPTPDRIRVGRSGASVESGERDEWFLWDNERSEVEVDVGRVRDGMDKGLTHGPLWAYVFGLGEGHYVIGRVSTFDALGQGVMEAMKN